MRDTCTIGFIMSHACPLKCDFCCHDRETIGSGRITRETVARTMIAFGAEESVTRFGFSGGEPFLYYEDIVAAITTAREAGVAQPFTIITSGYWGGRPDVRERLARLRDLGMCILSLSYDTEHAKWVTGEQIMDICQACEELGIRVDLYASFWDRSERIENLLPDIKKWANVASYWVVPSGRAARSGRRPNFDIREDQKYSCGNPGHYSIVFYPNGDAYPCCAGDFNQSAKLSCGNIKVDSPAAILDRAYSNFHVRTAKEFGWGALFELIGRECPELLPELPKFEDVDSACQICRDLNLRLAPKLKPIYEKMEREYARTMAEADWDSSDESEGAAAARRFGDKLLSRRQIDDLLDKDPDARRRYLTGRTCVGDRGDAYGACGPGPIKPCSGMQ